MDFKYLEKFIDGLFENGFSGSDCAVSYKGDIVFRHFAGYRDVENKKPVTGDELYFLYSASKVITITAAMMLYERGAFLLDDEVSEYIPEFKNMNIKRFERNGCFTLTPAKKPIRIHDLFTMSAGLTYDLNSPSIQAVREKTNGKCPTVETVKAIANEPLLFEPGERFNYSLCHDVIGALVEVLSGMKFGDFLKENIFEPLNMTRTGFDVNDDILDKMACQYQWENWETRRLVQIPKKNEFILGTEYQSGGAGLISCVDDYIKFSECLANGGNTKSGKNIISQATIDLIRQDHLNDVSREDFHKSSLADYSYGLGVRTMVDKARSSSNSPIGEFGWDGAAAAYTLIDPKNNLAIYYGTHVRNANGGWAHKRIRNIVYAALEK